MLQLHQVSVSFGSQIVLRDISLVVNPGDRIGVIGPNGCGKSTLLRVMARRTPPTRGEVRVRKGASVGLLEQSPGEAGERTVWQEMRSAVPGLDQARVEVENLATEMERGSGGELLRVTAAYGAAFERFESLGGYGIDDRILALLAGLGLERIDPAAGVSRLSGGQRTRIGLARLLLAAPDALLLDEPTNHLDIDALEWLERFVAGYRGAVVVVSHDRQFLDGAVDQVVAIDQKTRTAATYLGNYSAYAEQIARAAARQSSLYRVQQAAIRRMEQDIARRKQHAARTEAGTKNDFERRIAKKVARQAKARERKLDRFKSSAIVERPDRVWSLKLDFNPEARGGRRVLELVEAGHAYDTKRLFARVSLDARHGDRIALVGPNGCGKSTLLRAIAGEVLLTEGTVRTGAGIRTGFLHQEAPPLDGSIDALSAVRRVGEMDETEARNYLHYFLFAGDAVFVPYGELSYGERQRLQLALIVAAGANCLLLDEPANHLDIDSREHLEHALASFPGTVVAATHDRAFIDRWATAIWGFVHDPGQLPTIRRYVDREDLNRSLRRSREHPESRSP